LALKQHICFSNSSAAGTQLDIKKSTDNCIVEEYSENSTRESLDSGWICREGLIEAGTFHKYVSSLYWAFSTLTTVGYGDISAKTIPVEYILYPFTNEYLTDTNGYFQRIGTIIFYDHDDARGIMVCLHCGKHDNDW